jgi:hypothetical protein
LLKRFNASYDGLKVMKGGKGRMGDIQKKTLSEILEWSLQYVDRNEVAIMKDLMDVSSDLQRYAELKK